MRYPWDIINIRGKKLEKRQHNTSKGRRKIINENRRNIRELY